MFDPKTNKFPYTTDTSKHYLVVKKNRGIVFDENYPYIDNSKSFRFKQFLVRLLLYTIVFPVNRIRTGLRIKGRKNLRNHKDEIKKGVISCSNHVHMWDYICVMSGAKPTRTRMVVWAPNVNGENGTLIRLVGGIPIPESGIKATFAYLNAIEKYLNDGGWLHIYAEGSMWEYYQPIRPFKKGVSYFACKYNKPIIPMGFSYRKPSWIRRKIFKQIALLTLNIGEPIYPDNSLTGQEQMQDLTKRVHKAVCDLVGIEKNIYEPIYNNSARIDYYTDTYGVNYKGSH